MARYILHFIIFKQLILIGVDQYYRLCCNLLDLPCIKGPHSGENIAAVLSAAIDHYNIQSRLGYFMMDNASSNDRCVSVLSEKYPTLSAESRLRCIGHILNIIVKALLFGIGVSSLERQLCGASSDEQFEIWRKHSFIGKLHNICVWVNRSDQRRELFKTYIAEAYKGTDIEGLYQRLLVDGGIRWNAVYRMIERGKFMHSSDLQFVNIL